MYAIVEISGKQFKVTQHQSLYIPRLQAEVGGTVAFDQVLLIEDREDVAIGAPTVSGARVTGKVLDHIRGDKVIVFKKKRRKRYKKTQGHRRNYTKVLIEHIVK
mmetsp:Transcript_26948/g.62597  ORF Transcript_26948/g.62597 Transcript_26948/m.62597 type:complete len:104 (-) Transcript_26948:3650-3961(-)